MRGTANVCFAGAQMVKYEKSTRWRTCDKAGCIEKDIVYYGYVFFEWKNTTISRIESMLRLLVYKLKHCIIYSEASKQLNLEVKYYGINDWR